MKKQDWVPYLSRSLVFILVVLSLFYGCKENKSPRISGTPNPSVKEGEAYSFTPTASDPDDGDSLSFEVENLPAWASFDSNTGTLSGTPGSADIGYLHGYRHQRQRR